MGKSYYLAEERNTYVPPPCRDCCSENIAVEWVSTLNQASGAWV
jgi:hypothetical protein